MASGRHAGEGSGERHRRVLGPSPHAAGSTGRENPLKLSAVVGLLQIVQLKEVKSRSDLNETNS